MAYNRRMIRRIRQVFPRGPADFLLQLGIWVGFVLAYQVARGIADDGSAAEAMANGQLLIDVQRQLHLLFEPEIQRVVTETGGVVLGALNWTYWLSQFAVVGLALLWIYFFRTDAFARVRNWLIAANLLGLVGYVLVPTAPPRMFPEAGFVDTLAQSASLNHGSAIVELASNPYAAMPSLHAADSLIIGFAMAALVRRPWAKVLWTLWPTWVWFSVMATGNHFWLDIAAGVGVAVLAGTILSWHESRQQDVAAAASPPGR
jgi:membrane-associated phospholipid phosphatase